VAQSLLATPTAQLSTNYQAKGTTLERDNLVSSMVKQGMWPTPSAADNRDRGNMSSPAIARRKEKGKQIMLSQSVSHESGALNPEWVEWLMGFPPGWTDLAAGPESQTSQE
jgi:DNA (cytosine-5)-methyltransferase 1